MSLLRKFLLIILTLITLIGVSGCMKKQKEPSVKEQVEKYMEDKYNEKFKVIGGGSEGWNDSNEEIYVSSEKFPNAAIMIRRNKKSGEMVDNYVSYLMKSRVEEVMSEIVSEIYPKSKVLYRTTGAPQASATPQMSVDEYLIYSGKYIALSLTICISDPDYKTNKDQKLEQLRLKFEEKQYTPRLTIFYVVEDKLELVNETNIQSLYNNYPEVSGWATLRGDFFMDESYRFKSYSEWREIK